VQKIIAEIDKAVELVVHERGQAEEGLRIVKDTSMFQSVIADAASRARELMLKIKEMGPQQLQATEQVLDAVKEVAKIAQQNATSTEELSSNAEEVTASMQEVSSSATDLARSSLELRSLVAQFKVSASAAGADAAASRS
jgi:methyl-accepting chemotaxis protein